MSQINMQNFLNTIWEFTRGKENKDNLIQKSFKVCKVFKMKPLKAPRLDVPSKKTAYNLFCKDVQKMIKELQGVLSLRQVQSYQRNGKELRAAIRR